MAAMARGKAYCDDGLNGVAGTMRLAFESRERTYERCVHAIVVDPDAGEGLVEVRPIPKRRLFSTTGVKDVDRATVKVRRIRTAHGGFMVEAPLFKGDTGYLVACDRDCHTGETENCEILTKPDGEQAENRGSVAIDSNGVSLFSYGFFIPCSWHVDGAGEFSKDERFKDKLILRNVVDENGKTAYAAIDRDGNVDVSAGNGTAVISMTADGNVDVSAGNGTAVISMTADGNVDVSAGNGTAVISMTADGTIAVRAKSVTFETKKAKFSGTVDAKEFTKMGTPLTCPANGQMI